MSQSLENEKVSQIIGELNYLEVLSDESQVYYQRKIAVISGAGVSADTYVSAQTAAGIAYADAAATALGSITRTHAASRTRVQFYDLVTISQAYAVSLAISGSRNQFEASASANIAASISLNH